MENTKNSRATWQESSVIGCEVTLSIWMTHITDSKLDSLQRCCVKCNCHLLTCSKIIWSGQCKSGWNVIKASKCWSSVLKLRFNCDGHIFISFVFPQFTSFHSVFHSFHGLTNSGNKLACLQCMGLHSSAGRAVQRERRGHGYESRWSPEKPFFRALNPWKTFFSGYFAIA